MLRKLASAMLAVLPLGACKLDTSSELSTAEARLRSQIQVEFVAKLGSQLSESDARDTISAANECFKAAFAQAGAANEATTLILSSFRMVPEANPSTWALEPWDLAIDELGHPVSVPGCRATIFKVFFGAPAQARPYAPPDSPDFQLLVQWARDRARFEGICEPRAQCPPLTDEQRKELETRLLSLASSVIRLPSAAAIWMDEPRSYGNKHGIVFTHEFTHAWGGLDDRYHNPQAFDQTNLMGPVDQKTCKLEPGQIAAIREYRTNCNREELGELREMPGGRPIPRPNR